MEYQSLRDILTSRGGISASQFRMVAVELAGIIADHHERGLSHGFLSSERVAISADGDAQILGFGDEPGAEPFDPHPDLQAFGRILYELATGHPAQDFYPDLDRLPDELRPIVVRAIQGQYDNAREIAADLNAFQPAPPPPPPHAPRKYLWVVGALLLIAAVGVSWKRSRTVHRADRNAVTVVFFANLAQDRSLDWLSRGIPEMLTIGLQQVSSLEVIGLDRQIETLSRTSQAMTTLSEPSVATEVARESGADVAVTGSVTRQGPSTLRLEVRIQSTASGRDRTSFTLDAANPADIVKLMDSVTHKVAAELSGRPVLSGSTLASVTTANPEAMRHLMIGREYLRGGALVEAMKEFEESLRLDPGMPLASFETARIFRSAGDPARRYELLLACGQHLNRLPRPESIRWQVEMAALEGDNMKLGHSLMSLVDSFPRDTSARNELALQMAIANHAPAAMKLVQEGLVYDPDDASLLNQMVYAAAMSGDAAAVKKFSDRYIEVHPNDANALDTRGEAYYILGDHAEALKAFRDLAQAKPDFQDYSTYQKIALVLADQGSIDDAAESLAEYERRASPESRRFAAPLYQARLAEASGDNRQAAIAYLRAARAFSEAGRTAAAGDTLMSLANLAVLSRENIPGVLAFLKQQKLLGEELPAIAWLQAVTQDSAGAARSLELYRTSHPWLKASGDGTRMSLLHALIDGYGALARNDTKMADAILKQAPDENYSWLLYERGLAGEGEAALQRALVAGRALFLPPPLESPSPLRQKLILEKLGGKAPKAGKPKSETIHV